MTLGSDWVVVSGLIAAGGAVGAVAAGVLASRKTAQLQAATAEIQRQIETAEPASTAYDVFVSAASADSGFTDRLVRALRDQGLTVWDASTKLSVGDSLASTIAEGIARSRHGVIVLSPAFLRSSWPQQELDLLIKREQEGKGSILPIWNDIDEEDVRRHFPSVAGRPALHSGSETVDQMANEIARAVAKS